MESGFEYVDLGRIAYADALVRQTAAFEALVAAKAEGAIGNTHRFFRKNNPVMTIRKSGYE